MYWMNVAAFRMGLALLALMVSAVVAVGQEGPTLRGVVTGPDGNPVAGATVWLSQEQEVTQTASNADGAFRFEKLRVGPVEVVCRKAGLSLGGYSGFMAGDGDVAIALTKPEHLTIRLLDGHYEPIAGARIVDLVIGGIFSVPVEALVDHGFPPLRSGDDGQLTFEELPANSYLRFTVTHFDFTDLFVPYLPIVKRVQDFTMDPGFPLRGRVTVEDKGAAGAMVSLFMGTDKGPVARARVVTDQEGFYRLRAPAGNFAIAARHPDYAAPPPAQVRVQESEDNTANIALIVPRHIEGSVVYSSGQPAAGVRVGYRVGDNVFEETFTQRDGHFLLKVGTEAGLVEVVPPAGYMTEGFGRVPFDLGKKQAAKLSPIVLSPLPEMQGRVVDEQGKPVAGALVESRGLLPPFWRITDDDGGFFIQFPNMPQSPEVNFRAEHPLRFLRKDFTVNLANRVLGDVALAPYEPEVRQGPTAAGENDLSSLVGKPAPPLVCDTWINSEPLTLEGLRGKVVVLIFWGTFDDSPHGLNALLEMEVLHQLYHSVDDVVIAGIHDASVEPDEVEAFVKRLGLTFPIGCDADPFQTFVAYGVNFIPQTVLIDKAGVFQFYQAEGRIPALIKVLRRRDG